MRESLKKELAFTQMIHSPLPIHEEDTAESRWEKKPVQERILLDDLSTLEHFEISGPHTQMKLSDTYTKTQKNSVCFTAPTRVNEWTGWPGGIMCIPGITLKINHENWEKFNRISFWVLADMPGFHSISFRMQFHNEGKHPVPDQYEREGHHNVNLVHGKWRHVTVEIPYLSRDDVTGLSFEYDMCGNEITATETACFYITDIYLERLDEKDLDHYSGWNTDAGRIAYSGSGYQTGSIKTAIVCNPEIKNFRVVNTKSGKTVLEKPVQTVKTSLGEFQVLDFSELWEEGEYFLVSGELSTRSFPIGDYIWEDSIWKTLNFFFCERCGFSVPHKHGVCHRDRTTAHKGQSIVSNGGWHDAGDMSQNLTNTAESTYALFALYEQVKEDPVLSERVLEEAKWGLDFMLKTRFGDGYRTMGCGGSCWTYGILGDWDDCQSDAENKPIENFMASGAEALAAIALKGSDPVLSAYALKCAKEDWRFAYEARDTEGYTGQGDPGRASHQVVMYSCAVWSALDIYSADQDPYFKDMAVLLAKEVIACQQQEIPDWEIPMTGFFYRDSSQKQLLHYNHRSHESEPLLALSKLCQILPDHEDYIHWYYALTLYSEYQKKAASYMAPYYMAPASIYHIDEANKDPELFVKQQASAGDETIPEYEKQVKEGICLGSGYYLRRFPVWFAFRGNNAVTLSAGKAAACSAKIRNDYEAAELAQRQLEWIVGKNPFAQSVMFGEGYDYSQQYAVLPGEMVGELPVGIEAPEHLDIPFWPQVNTCTYKEVWIHVPLRWIWLLSDVYGASQVSGMLNPGKGNLIFQNTLSGREYQIVPDEQTGSFSASLPAGNYNVSYDTQTKSMTLISGKKYQLTNPFKSYQIIQKRIQNQIKISVTSSIESSVSLLSENVLFETWVVQLPANQEITITGTIPDEKKPYLALLLPEGNVAEAIEVFGQ